jgi:hypothetical protein
VRATEITPPYILPTAGQPPGAANRRVLAWRVSISLDAGSCIEALADVVPEIWTGG